MCCSQFPNCSMLFIVVTFKPNKPFNPLYWILFLFLSSLTHFTLSPVLSVWCPGLHLQPLSSTSCLCKDPATAVVSIVFVQTPWCRDIHSLFPVPPEEAGGTKDYEMSFPEPFFCFIQNFFFLLSNWCFFFSPLSSSCSGTVLISNKLFLSSFSPKVPLSHWAFFSFKSSLVFSGTVMEGKVG